LPNLGLEIERDLIMSSELMDKCLIGGEEGINRKDLMRTGCSGAATATSNLY